MSVQETIRKPYIGVTGISHINEAKAIALSLGLHLPDNGTHQGMVGYLVSEETLNGARSQFDKYPDIRDLPVLLEETKDFALNSLHYRSQNPITLAPQLEKLFDEIYPSGLCRMVQLNMTWPPISSLIRIKDKFPELDIVLQLNKTAMAEPRVSLPEKLNDYKEWINYVLIDPSGGLGQEFDHVQVASIYRLIRNTLPTTTVIIAGGFDERNVLRRLIELYQKTRTRQFGIDAEGRLRDDIVPGKPHSGTLSIIRTSEYISKAAKFFNAN